MSNNEIYAPYIGQTASEIVDILRSIYTDVGGDERKFMMKIINSKDSRLHGTSHIAIGIFFALLKESK